MRIRRLINRAIHRNVRGGSVAAAVNAVVSANVDERGRSSTSVSSRQRVVQRGGRTVSEQRSSEGSR